MHKFYALIVADEIYIYDNWNKAAEEKKHHFYPHYKGFNDFQSAYDWSRNQKNYRIEMVGFEVMTIEAATKTFAFANRDEANAKFISLKRAGEFAIAKKDTNIVGITCVPTTPFMLRRYSFKDGMWHEYWYSTEEACHQFKEAKCDVYTSCTVSNFFKEVYQLHVMHVPMAVRNYEISH